VGPLSWKLVQRTTAAIEAERRRGNARLACLPGLATLLDQMRAGNVCHVHRRTARLAESDLVEALLQIWLRASTSLRKHLRQAPPTE